MVMEVDRIDVVKNAFREKAALLVDASTFIDTFTDEYTGNKTNLSIITPNEGKKLRVREVIIVTDASSGVVKLDFASSNIKVARLYCSKENTLQTTNLHLVGAVDEPLSLTTTTGDEEVFIIVNYIQE